MCLQVRIRALLSIGLETKNVSCSYGFGAAWGTGSCERRKNIWRKVCIHHSSTHREKTYGALWRKVCIHHSSTHHPFDLSPPPGSFSSQPAAVGNVSGCCFGAGDWDGITRMKDDDDPNDEDYDGILWVQMS